MEEIQTIITMLVGFITIGLVAELVRAVLWCSVGWVFFRKWFRRG